MNYIGVVLLSVLVASVTDVTAINDFERGVLKLIEKCKRGDVWSLPVSLPSLTPLILPPRTTYDGQFTMYVSEKMVYGLENLSVDKLVSTSPSKMYIEFSVPQLQVYADKYLLQSQLIFFFRLIDDEGSFRCDVSNVKVRANVQFAASGANTVITSLDLSYSIGDLRVYLSGSSELVHNGVRDKLWKRIHSDETKQRIRNAVMDRARKYLRGHTPEQFRKIISSV